MIFRLTQISRISQKNASFHSRLPSGWPHTSDSDVCLCEIREICVRQQSLVRAIPLCDY